MKAIICSTKDIAGMTMFDIFLEKGFKLTDNRWEGNEIYELGDWMLIRTDKDLIYFDDANQVDAEEIVFASRHKSASGDPTLTAHACGNFGPADFGGTDGKLSVASANSMCNIYHEMVKCGLDYKVSLEVTHHGPLVDVPHCWVELGSSEPQWEDTQAAEFLVSCILAGIKSDTKTQPAIGIGGTHYCPNFSKHEGEYAFGHILPKYAQDYLNLEMVKQMIEKTLPATNKVVIDKKGIRQQAKVQEMLKDYEVVLV